jgi:hypothetical protein
MQIKVYTIEFKLPRWVKRTLLFAGIPLAVLLGVGAAVRAAVTFPVAVSSFAESETLSATKLNTNLTTLQDGVNSLNTTLTSQQSTISSLQTSVASLQASLSTVQGQLTSGDGVKASSLTSGTVQLATRILASGGLKVAAGTNSVYHPSPSCDLPNEFVLGGGCIGDANNQGSNVLVTGNLPDSSLPFWKCAVKNNATYEVTLVSEVVCGRLVIR